jgi:hypothetical protein
MVSSKPSLIERPTPPCPRNDTKTTSTPWSSESSTTRPHSTNCLQVTFSTMRRCTTSTSLSAVGYIKRRSGSASTTMVLSQATSAPRALMSNHTSSTSTSPPTTASIHLSQHYPHGSATCSPGQEATSTSFKTWWPRLTIGAWRGRLHATGRLTMTSPISWSRSRSTNGTSKQHKLTLHHVSPTLCPPTLQSMSKCFIMCQGR